MNDEPARSTSASLPRPLIIGEVLFDCFPSGDHVLGGAPFNVAWNLRGLGADPLLVSAVGDDPEGREVQRRMDAWGLDRSALQVDAAHPTGKVQVEIRGGEPRYDILPERAWDYIRPPQFAATAGSHALLYYGSLAWRSAASRETIRALKSSCAAPVFVDVNIRPPWFDDDLAPQLLRDAKWVKLNVDELTRLSGSPCESRNNIITAVRRLAHEFGAANFWVTCGREGAYAIDEQGGIEFAPAPLPPAFVDSVGAGDAFAAVAILGVLRDWSAAETLRRAVEFAARVCGLQGATSADRTFYKTEWTDK